MSGLDIQVIFLNRVKVGMPLETKNISNLAAKVATLGWLVYFFPRGCIPDQPQGTKHLQICSPKPPQLLMCQQWFIAEITKQQTQWETYFHPRHFSHLQRKSFSFHLSQTAQCSVPWTICQFQWILVTSFPYTQPNQTWKHFDLSFALEEPENNSWQVSLLSCKDFARRMQPPELQLSQWPDKNTNLSHHVWKKVPRSQNFACRYISIYTDIDEKKTELNKTAMQKRHQQKIDIIYPTQ